MEVSILDHDGFHDSRFAQPFLWFRWRFCRILRDRLRTLAHEATQEPYDPAYIHELNLRIFNAEKQTLQSLRELAEWDRSVISPRRQIFQCVHDYSVCFRYDSHDLLSTILPMRFSHDFSKGVVDIKDKSSEVMPEWNIEDQGELKHRLSTFTTADGLFLT